MKSRNMSIIAVLLLSVTIIMCIVAAVAYPMHIGEPSYYHIARVDCLLAACTCALVAILAAIASANF